MAFFDILVLILVGVVVGGGIGAGFAKFTYSYLKKRDKFKLYDIINGKTKNILKLDGEIIDVDYGLETVLEYLKKDKQEMELAICTLQETVKYNIWDLKTNT